MQNTPSEAPPSSAIGMRRAGLILVCLMITVFITETTLARLRHRDVSVSLSVKTAATSTPTPGTAVPTEAATADATDQPGPTKTPAPAILVIAPNDQLVVNVTWNYRIGPRFPHTTIYAVSQIDGRSVAEGQVKIDCGTEVLNCSGTQSITLQYTIPDTGTGAQQIAWPVGDYQLVVDRSDGGLTPITLQQTEFRVR